jgi:hypothetical protein
VTVRTQKLQVVFYGVKEVAINMMYFERNFFRNRMLFIPSTSLTAVVIFLSQVSLHVTCNSESIDAPQTS